MENILRVWIQEIKILPHTNQKSKGLAYLLGRGDRNLSKAQVVTS